MQGMLNHKITWAMVAGLAKDIAYSILQTDLYNTVRELDRDKKSTRSMEPKRVPPLKIYGIPRGGIYAAQAVMSALSESSRVFELTTNPHEADFFIDDIIDSGTTRDTYIEKYGKRHFFALLDNTKYPKEGPQGWFEFPWETQSSEVGIEENITRIIQFIGDDPTREGLRETPARVIKSYSELFAGYKQDPASVFKIFEDGACDEMVILSNIEFYSTCEHHMLPFSGHGHIAYIPNKRIIGLSKLARLLDIVSKRLQVQERLTTQITDLLNEHLQPLGSACVLEAKHFCMCARGVKKQSSSMRTSSLTGVFKEAAVRQEFLTIISNK